MVILYFILVFGSIITIHEVGHLVAAKYFNVYCEEFAFGMGPKVFSKKYKETTYSIRLLPLGGFVAMAGEPDAMFDQTEIPVERTIKGISKWKQIIIMLAGVFMNFLLAIVLFIGVNLMNPQVQLPAKPVVASVVEGSPADVAGILPDDMIIEVIYPNNTMIQPETFSEIGTYFQLFPDEPIKFVVRRALDQNDYTLEVTPVLDEQSNRYLIGITGVPGDVVTLSPMQSVKQGFIDFKQSSKLIFEGFKFLIQGVGVNNLSGPIGIIDMTDQVMSQSSSFHQSVSLLMILIATFSVNLGIVNLIPLPMFDGGRVLLLLYEIIFRKKVNRKVENSLMLVSFFLIILLMLFTTFNDLFRIIFR